MAVKKTRSKTTTKTTQIGHIVLRCSRTTQRNNFNGKAGKRSVILDRKYAYFCRSEAVLKAKAQITRKSFASVAGHKQHKNIQQRAHYQRILSISMWSQMTGMSWEFLRLVEILKTHSENTTDLLTSSKVETTKTAQRQQYDGIFTPPTPGKTTTATTEVLIIASKHWGRSTVPTAFCSCTATSKSLPNWRPSIHLYSPEIKCKKKNKSNQIACA